MAARVADGLPPQDEREGAFGVPVGQVVAHLQAWLTAKYVIDAAYRSFADRSHGPWRDSLVDHWYKHAKEERDQAYDLAMKVAALGGDPIVTTVQVPPCVPNIVAFCAVLSDLELKAIDKGRAAIAMSGQNDPLRVMAEQIIMVDSHHLDDIRRLCVNSTGV